MDNWDEVKTALHLARIGTVSGAAEVLGVHHATVIRHIHVNTIPTKEAVMSWALSSRKPKAIDIDKIY